MSQSKGSLSSKGSTKGTAGPASRIRRTVFFRYKDKNRGLYYYYDPVEKRTVWEAPKGVIIKDGKTNMLLSDPSKKPDIGTSLLKKRSAPKSSSPAKAMAGGLSSDSRQSSTNSKTSTSKSSQNVEIPSSKPHLAEEISPKTLSPSTSVSTPSLTGRPDRVWRRALCGDDDNLREYFYVTGTSERSWWIPGKAWYSKDVVEAYPRIRDNSFTRNSQSEKKQVSEFDVSQLDPVVGARFLADKEFLEALNSAHEGQDDDNEGRKDADAAAKNSMWIVRLHPATGQFYYINKATGLEQWLNPFDHSLEIEDEREQEEQDVEAAVEMLVGREYVRLKANCEMIPRSPHHPTENVHDSQIPRSPSPSSPLLSKSQLRSSMDSAKSVSSSWRGSPLANTNGDGMISLIDHSRDNIQQFIDTNRLAFSGPRAAALLAFPEYIDPCYVKKPKLSVAVDKIPFAVSDTVRIRIFKPTTSRRSQEYNTIMISPDASVGEVLDRAIRNCVKGGSNDRGGNTSAADHRTDNEDSLSPDCYALKATGVHSYLVHLEYPLIWYEVVQNAVRESGGILKEKSTIQLSLVRLSSTDAEQVRLIRGKLRHDLPECTDEELATVMDAAQNIIQEMKIDEGEKAFESIYHRLIKYVGVSLTRRYAFAIRALVLESKKRHALQGPSKCISQMKNRGKLTKCPVGLLDWSSLDSMNGGSTSISQLGKFQDSRRGRFQREHWMEKMRWPLRIFLRGMENVSTRWSVPSGKDSSRYLQVQYVDLVVGLYNNGKLLRQKGGRSSSRFPIGSGAGYGGAQSNENFLRLASRRTVVNSTIHWPSGEQCLEFFGVQMCDLPHSTRLGFTLRGYTSDDHVENLAASSMTLLDAQGHMRQGSATVHFWLWHQRDRCPMNPGTVIPARSFDSHCSLTFEFDRFPIPIVASKLKTSSVLCASPGTSAALSGFAALSPEEITSSSVKKDQLSLSASQRNLIRLGGSHKTSARQVVATISGVCENSGEADLEAALVCERHAEAFLVAQAVAKTFPNLPMIEKRAKIIVRIPSGVMSEATEAVVRSELSWSTKDDKMLQELSMLTPLDDDTLFAHPGIPGELTPSDWIWAHRYHCCATSSKMLAKFLKVVDWGNHSQAREAREIMARWHVERPEIALELLGQNFSDPIVRAYAVHHLSKMKDKDLQSYMLQLVQCLKFEPHDDSVLLRFMLRRALRNPLRVGAIMFWLLRSELHNRETLGRYGMLLELYVRNCGPHRESLSLIHETVSEVSYHSILLEVFVCLLIYYCILNFLFLSF